MQEHEQRLLDEKQELDNKIEKLSDFIKNNNVFKLLSFEYRFLLEEQLTTMRSYSYLLGRRISLFDSGN